MSRLLLLATLLVACGGEEKKPAPVTPPPAAPAPAPTPAPPPPAQMPTAAAPAPTGPYTPDELAKAAYDKSKAAGADKATNPKAGDAAAIAAGKAQFETKCVTCHGPTGMGDGIAGQALPQKPANFHDKSRWDYSTVGTKHWIIMNGIQGTAMAPLGLTDDQAWEALAYIQSEFAGK